MDLFEKYGKVKRDSLIYEQMLVSAPSDEMKSEMESVKKASKNYTRKFTVIGIFEGIAVIIALICIVSVIRSAIDGIFNTMSIIFLSVGMVFVIIAVMLFMVSRRALSRMTKFKRDIEPACEKIDELVSRSLPFDEKDILLNIELDVLVPVYRKEPEEGKRKKPKYTTDSKRFLIVKNELYISDDGNFLKIPFEGYAGIKEIDIKYRLQYFPGDRIITSKKYKHSKFKSGNGFVTGGKMCVLEFLSGGQPFTVSLMPYDRSMAEYFLRSMEKAFRREFRKAGNDDGLVVACENALPYAAHSVSHLKKLIKKNAKVLILGYISEHLTEEILEQNVTVDYAVPNADWLEALEATYGNYDNIKFFDLKGYAESGAAAIDTVIVSTRLLESETFSDHVDFVSEAVTKAGIAVAVKSRFNKSCDAVFTADKLLSEKYPEYEPMSNRAETFDRNINITGIRFSRSFPESISAVSSEFAEIFLAAFKYADEENTKEKAKEIEGLLKELFIRYAEDGILELEFSTLVHTSKRAD